MIKEVNTPKELYEYCKEFGAENWKIVIRESHKMEKPKAKGLYIVTDDKKVLIVN